MRVRVNKSKEELQEQRLIEALFGREKIRKVDNFLESLEKDAFDYDFFEEEEELKRLSQSEKEIFVSIEGLNDFGAFNYEYDNQYDKVHVHTNFDFDEFADKGQNINHMSKQWFNTHIGNYFGYFSAWKNEVSGEKGEISDSLKEAATEIKKKYSEANARERVKRYKELKELSQAEAKRVDYTLVVPGFDSNNFDRFGPISPKINKNSILNGIKPDKEVTKVKRDPTYSERRKIRLIIESLSIYKRLDASNEKYLNVVQPKEITWSEKEENLQIINNGKKYNLKLITLKETFSGRFKVKYATRPLKKISSKVMDEFFMPKNWDDELV